MGCWDHDAEHPAEKEKVVSGDTGVNHRRMDSGQEKQDLRREGGGCSGRGKGCLSREGGMRGARGGPGWWLLFSQRKRKRVHGQRTKWGEYWAGLGSEGKYESHPVDREKKYTRATLSDSQQLVELRASQ